MRVIAGSSKRTQLKTLEGLETRPTTDRIKETLFNMLQYDLYDTLFLDLFSGSGAIGIEALSRGAREVTFIEQNPKAIQCIQENLRVTKLESNAKLLQDDVFFGLHKLTQVYDYIFMDPPYNRLLEKQVLEYLITSSIISADTLIIIEASKETTMDYIESLGYEIMKIKEYKTNKHIFIQKYNKGEQ